MSDMRVLKANADCPDCHGEGMVPHDLLDANQYLKKSPQRAVKGHSFCECILQQLSPEDLDALASPEGLDIDIISTSGRSAEV
jgi:hypothetical protein